MREKRKIQKVYETLSRAEKREREKRLNKIEETGSTNVMIEADATCSQKQIVAVLTKCKTTASTCNVYNPGNEYIQDAYGLVADEMSRLLEESINK